MAAENLAATVANEREVVGSCASALKGQIQEEKINAMKQTNHSHVDRGIHIEIA